MINLISDTVTKPSKNMLNAMMEAKVGDDVFQADPTINQLQTMVADMFGKEAALFCPSGTMTNQIAIKVHTKALDEVICDHYSHVYQYETGGYAFNSGVAVNLIQGQYGKVTASQVQEAVKPKYDWLPISKLVVLENSTNKGGGNYYELEEMMSIKEVCQKNKLKLHLDGARIFNVLVEKDYTTKDLGQIFDSISICISKGLGAPVGSLLIGDQDFIDEARRFRKVMGGGMRQAGYLAAACIYALENNVERLKIDNDRAKEIGQLLSTFDFVKAVEPVKTNIVIFHLRDGLKAQSVLDQLKEKHINASAFGPETVRFVFHLDISDGDFIELIKIINSLSF